MSNPSPNHAALHRQRPAEWVARREESIKRIGALLAEQPMILADIAKACGRSPGTVYGHLIHMEWLGLAHRTAERRGNNVVWAAGEKPIVVEPEETQERGPRTVVARQVGMWRDPLIAALFGPALPQSMIQQG